MLLWNANSVKPKKSELANFLLINNIDVAANSETKLHPKQRYAMHGYCVYRITH